MKITIEISDSLHRAARQVARRDHITLRALVEHGFRLALAERRRSALLLALVFEYAQQRRGVVRSPATIQ